MQIEIVTWDEFCERHGGQPVSAHNRYLFPDGAATDYADRVRWEPPADPTARLKKQAEYWEARVEQAENRFAQTKAAFVEQGYFHQRCPYNCPPPPANSAEILRGLKAEVTVCRRGLARTVRKLEDTPEAQRRLRMNELQNEYRSEQSELLAEVQAINI